MKSEIQVNNSVANVIRFIAIEIILAILIEPAVAEINRIRAQRLARSGRRVRIRTSLLQRDFSGPAIGGKKGILWKIFVLVGLLAALLATEFAFDYDVKTIQRGSTIPLTGLSKKTTDIPRSSMFGRTLGKRLFNLVRCSYVEGNMRYERRLRPNGECYSGNNSGFSFPEPCVLDSVEAHNHSCLRTDQGIVKQEGTEGFSASDDFSEIFDAGRNATYIGPNEEITYQGKRGKNGEHMRYCSRKFVEEDNSSGGSRMCMEYLDSGDLIISLYRFQSEDQLTPGGPRAYPDFFQWPVIRLGADTFSESGCATCGARIMIMLDFVSRHMAVEQDYITIQPDFTDYGIAVAMVAMGLPKEIGRAVDDQDIEEVGFLIIDWNLVLPLAVVTVVALFVILSSCMIKQVINLPLEYASAMYAAYDREVSGGDCNSKQPKCTYDVGLVETCEKDVLYLSLNAKDPVRYNGEEIRGTTAFCGRFGCRWCSRKMVSKKEIDCSPRASADMESLAGSKGRYRKSGRLEAEP